MNIFRSIVIVLFFPLLLTACSDSDSSTEDSVTNSDASVTFASNETTVDEVFELAYNLGADQITGTINWGDNTTSRIRGSGTIRHIYRADGTRTIALQIDGDDKKAVGQVRVQVRVEDISESDQTPESASARLPIVVNIEPSIASCLSNQATSEYDEIITVLGRRFVVSVLTVFNSGGNTTSFHVQELGTPFASMVQITGFCTSGTVIEGGLHFIFKPSPAGGYGYEVTIDD